MSFVNTGHNIRDLYDFAVGRGFTEDLFFSAENMERYIETSVDAYREYPLFLHIFGGKYDANTLSRMMFIDFKSRLDTMAGIASSENYESIMMLEPPRSEKTGMLKYIKAADPASYTLIFKPAVSRLGEYEKYALEKRKEYLDEKTWYMYIFTTKQEFQHRGYGKKVMELILSYMREKNLRICLETNLQDDVPLYEHFGFKTMNISEYKYAMGHWVMLYSGSS